MAWQFQEQEELNIQRQQRAWTNNVWGEELVVLRNCVQDSYIQGFMSCNNKNMTEIHDWMRANDFQDSIRSVRSLEDFMNFVTNINVAQA